MPRHENIVGVGATPTPFFINHKIPILIIFKKRIDPISKFVWWYYFVVALTLPSPEGRGLNDTGRQHLVPRRASQGRRPYINFHKNGTSRTPSPTQKSACFARTPSHTSIFTNKGRCGTDPYINFHKNGTSRTPSPTVISIKTGDIPNILDSG